MSNANDLLSKVITAGATDDGSLRTGGGLLSPEQGDRFIDYMWDNTVLSRFVRKVRMRADTVELNRMAVGEKLVRLATEAVDDHVNAGATFSKISLTTSKLRLDWELSTESLEDNIEGADLEDHIARLMATQAGKDIEDLMINGDTDKTTDALYKAFDGFSKRAKSGGHVIDAAGAEMDRGLLRKALNALPRQYKQNKNDLRFFAGSNLISDYQYSHQRVSNDFPVDAANATAHLNRPVTPEGPAGFVYDYAFGYSIVEVPLMNENQTFNATDGHTEAWLTFPKNLLMGIKREIKVLSEYKNKKDTVEYTVYTRVGVQIENLDCFVVVKNIRLSE